MSVRINTNVEALNAQRNLNVTATVFARSVERLSSGLRINRAADDAAGLAISQKLSAQVNGLNQAQRNAQDGISMVQTTEGALNEVHTMLQRIRELGVEASNSTLSQEDTKSIADEVSALHSEIDRIANSAKFNGQNLLTGALSVTQSGGGLTAGTTLKTGHNATIAKVDVSGARANATYTLTDQGSGKVTLSDGTKSEQVTLTAIGATNTETITFDQLGVAITVVGDATKSATELAADLAAAGGSAPVIGIGGASGTNLVNGDVLSQPVTTTVVAGGGVFYSGAFGIVDSGGTTPLTASASAGVAAGTMILIADPNTGAVTGTLGAENFSGTIVASPGSSTTLTLTGDPGHTIDLNYKEGGSSSVFGVANDLFSSSFTFGGSATVSGMTAQAGAGADTHTFTSTAPNSVTLTGPGGSQTVGVPDIAAGATQTLNFNTLGISFTLTAGGTGIAGSSLIASLTSPAHDTIVVTSSGGGGGGTITTGAGSGSANFQIGANATDGLAVNFGDATVTAAGYGTWNTAIANFVSATNSGTGIIAAAQALVSGSDTAIGYISKLRGGFGAVQNRLEHTIASIGVAAENLNASNSRIRDLDVASEMVTFTKTQILQQAGTAILAQANQAPQGILSLLRG